MSSIASMTSTAAMSKTMRRYIDCRSYPIDIKCSLALSADSEDELLEAAAQHAVAVHKYEDTPELRATLKTLFKVGTPAG